MEEYLCCHEEPECNRNIMHFVCVYVFSWLGCRSRCWRFWGWTWHQSTTDEPYPLCEDSDERWLFIFTHTHTHIFISFTGLWSFELCCSTVPLIGVNSVCIVLLLLFGWRVNEVWTEQRCQETMSSPQEPLWSSSLCSPNPEYECWCIYYKCTTMLIPVFDYNLEPCGMTCSTLFWKKKNRIMN